jgi:hypothetical protein
MRAAAFVASKPRDGGGTTEDAVAMNPEKGIYAISDGVTNSVHSGALARLLVAKWAEQPADSVDALGGAWLKKVQADWSQETAKLPGNNAWFNVGQRGDATFLGARLVERAAGTKLEVKGIGDSMVFVVRKGQLSKSFPFERSDQFTNVVKTIPSKGNLEAPLSEVAWDMEEGDEVFMTTDALGKWTFTELEAGRDPFPRLREPRSHDAWTTFVANAQAGGAGATMDVDDAALVRFVVPTR